MTTAKSRKEAREVSKLRMGVLFKTFEMRVERNITVAVVQISACRVVQYFISLSDSTKDLLSFSTGITIRMVLNG